MSEDQWFNVPASIIDEKGKNLSFRSLYLVYLYRMTTSTRMEETVTILSIQGDIDLESSPLLRQELKKLSSAKTARLLLDFSETTYIDSSGLATLIEYFQSAAAYQGKMGLFGLSPRVKNSFSIVRLEEVFSFYADITTGVQSLKL